MKGGGRLRKTGRKGFGAAGSHTLRWQPLFRGKGKMERVGRVGGVGAKVLKDGWKSNGWMGGGGRALLYRPRAQRHLYIYICLGTATDTRSNSTGLLTRERVRLSGERVG